MDTIGMARHVAPTKITNVPLVTIGMEVPVVLNNKIVLLEHIGMERPAPFSSRIVLLVQNGMEQPAVYK